MGNKHRKKMKGLSPLMLYFDHRNSKKFDSGESFSPEEKFIRLRSEK